MSQITYPLERNALRAGMKADLGQDVCKSYKNTTGAALPFGVMVALGAADDRLKRLTGPSDKLIGVVVHEHGLSNQGAAQTSSVPFGTTPDTDSWEIPDKKVASVMRKGFVVVAVEAAVGAETDAWVRVTAGAGEVVGAFRGDPDGTDAIRVEGARFVTSTAGAGFAILELDSPKVDTRPDLIEVTVGDEAAVAANAREYQVAVKNPDGTAITVARQLAISCTATTADKGDIDAAGTPVGTLDVSNDPATGDNNAALLTTAAGLGAFRVTDDQAENVVIVITGHNCRPVVIKSAFA